MRIGYVPFSEAKRRLETSVNRLEYTLDEWQKIRVHYMEDPVRQHFNPIDGKTREQFYAYPEKCRAVLGQQRLALQLIVDYRPN